MPEKNNIPPLPSGYEEVPPLPSGYEAVSDEQPLKKKVSTETGTSTSSGSVPLIFKDIEPYTGAPKSISNQFVSEVPSTEKKIDYETPLKEAQAISMESWKDSPEAVRLDVKNNAIKNSSLIFNAKQQSLIDRSKEQFSTNPIFSETNLNAAKNKKIYLDKLVDLGYDKKALSEQLGIEYDPSSPESVVNSIVNIPTKVQMSIPNAKLAVLDILVDFATQPLIGERNTEKEIPELKAIQDYRNSIYGEKKQLREELLPTKKIISSYKAKDAAALLAASFDALTSLASTATTAIPTQGASIFTDMAGDFIYTVNEEKAKELGVSIEELYNTGENELAAPVALSTFAGLTESAGLKGMKDVILNSVKSGAGKKVVDILLAGNKEGLTEWIQYGLEEYNKLLASETAEDAAEKTWDKMLSEEAFESYLQGAVGGTGATGVAVLMTKKSELETEVKRAVEEGRVADAEMYSKEAQNVDNQIRQEVNNKVESDLRKVESTVKVENDKEELSRLTSELNKEGLTASGKEVITKTIQELNNSISQREGYNALLNQIESAKTEKDLDSYLKEADEKGLASPELMDEITLKRQQINEAKSKTVDTEVAAESIPTPEADIPATTETKIVEPLKTKTDAIQEPSTEGVFPREQGEISKTGGEREGMGQRVEGTEIAQESQKEIRADEKAQAEGMSFETEEEFDRYVSENSESPKELAETYQRRLANRIDSFGTLIDVIKQRGLKMPFESWKRFGEPRDVTENKKLYDKYIDENATPLDEVAMELGYSPEDIIEAIRWHELKKLEPKGNPITEKIKEKYEALTGKKLTPKTARESIAEMTDEEAKELAALEKDYEKAIATGRLSVIDGEIVSQPELKTYKRDVSKRIKTLKDKFAEFEQYFAQKVKPEEGKRKQAKSERKAFMEGKDPRTQYIMENMDNILKQLVEKGVVTTNCL